MGDVTLSGLTRRSTFLFTIPDWIDGLSSIFDVAGRGPRYATSPTPAEADRRAFEQDGKAIAEDLSAVLVSSAKR